MAEPATVQRSRRRPLVAYVEDDDATAEMYATSMRDQYQIVRLRSGREAIRWLDELEDADLPNLILLDYSLPDISGVEILAYVRQRSRFDHVMAMILSNHNDADTREVAFRLGALGWLLKNALTPQQVSRRLRQALERRGQVG